MKRILSATLSLMLLLGMLSGCSKNDGETPAASGVENTENAETAKDAENPADQTGDAGFFGLPVAGMVTEETYGQWIGRQGICLDYCNNRQVVNDTISVLAGETDVTLSGWAADFNADAPLQALYVRFGEQMLQCDYGAERQGVVDHYGKESLRNTGFEVAIPAEQLAGVTELSFIGISTDAANEYEPVSFQVTVEG